MPVGLLVSAKDKLLSRALVKALNRQCARYGAITRLEINSRRKLITARVRLAGESEEIAVSCSGYRVRPSEGRHWLHLGTCAASRPWLQNLLEDHVATRPIPLPGGAHFLL
jgi:hypothetical protein